MQTREPTRTYPAGANRSRQSPSSIGITYRLHGSNNEQQDAQNQSTSYAEMDRVIGEEAPAALAGARLPGGIGADRGQEFDGCRARAAGERAGASAAAGRR